ncbi:SDR family NAD(P)-dependent oxidoreductase, partial [Klebsiella pneumoniae]|uniref:SDR family NAD(P)-dependent oxidoreductase n=1 Tax=Klebsiella pneumoniae TaxID=573 RepID=UPI00359C42EC
MFVAGVSDGVGRIVRFTLLVDVSPEPAAEPAASRYFADGLAANVADEVQVQAAIEQILAKYGRVDVLVNNAGITQPLKLM